MRISFQNCLVAASLATGTVQAFVAPTTSLAHVPVRGNGQAPYSARDSFDATSCRKAGRSARCRRRSAARMMAKINPPPTENTKNLGSYYRRPSAAIEKGGGFFVPGLEGFRLRFVLAAVVLGLLSLNGFSRPGMTLSQVVSQSLAFLAGVVLFAQALLDQQKERAVEMRREAIAAAPPSTGGDGAKASTAKGQVAFFDSAELGADLEKKVKWAADILLQLTAACTFVVFSDRKLLARVGETGGESDDASVIAAAFEWTTAAAAAAVKAGTEDRGFPSAIIVKDNDENVQALNLLPSVCRQGVLCKINGPSCGRGVVVLLGSTVAGSGVFSGLDGAWFERVCALLALPTTEVEMGQRR